MGCGEAKVSEAQADPGDSKERILKTAIKIFAEKGLDGARINDIAAQAGLNKRMIYHYFGSKENLYVEVLRENIKKVCDAGASGYDPKDDLQTNIQRILKKYMYFLAENEDFLRLVNWEALNRGAYVAGLLSEFRNRYQESLNEMLEKGMENGLLRSDLDVAQLLLSIDGLCLIYFTHNETFKRMWKSNTGAMLEKRIDHIFDLLLNGIIKK